MGFSSIDALVSAISVSNRIAKLGFNKTITTGATSAAGRWHEILSSGGTGGSMVLTGTAGVGVSRNRASVGALPLNADVGALTRHLLSMTAITSSATAVPAYLLLTDIIHIYPSLTLTGTPTTLSNHPVWTGTGDTRLTNANGVQASLIVTTATTAGNGQITLTYTNEAGISGRTTAAPQGSLFAPAASTPVGTCYGQTNTAVTVGGLFHPTQAGDLGIQSVQSYVINTGATSGVGCLVLHRPIAYIPLVAANVAGERDFLNQIPALPRIYDDSCLGMFIQVGGALTAGSIVCGEIQYAWN
ncbi:hypothetical protein [Pseudanabaena phage PA-SR01]|nr:hypothetical protein [Pseudanabaena phage PA-SR01]